MLTEPVVPWHRHHPWRDDCPVSWRFDYAPFHFVFIQHHACLLVLGECGGEKGAAKMWLIFLACCSRQREVLCPASIKKQHWHAGDADENTSRAERAAEWLGWSWWAFPLPPNASSVIEKYLSPKGFNEYVIFACRFVWKCTLNSIWERIMTKAKFIDLANLFAVCVMA